MESGELSREGVVRDEATGELFIPATRRADGTWRKPRRVKEGYLPPEEVPAFETKGNQWAKNQPTGPVGLHIDEKQQAENAMSKSAKKNAKRKEKKKQQKSDDPDVGETLSPPDRQNKPPPSSDNDRVKSVDKPCDPSKEADHDATKRMRNLRKKLKQIDDIKKKIDSGELKNPEKDQLEKISRRQMVADELEELMRNLNVDN